MGTSPSEREQCKVTHGCIADGPLRLITEITSRHSARKQSWKAMRRCRLRHCVGKCKPIHGRGQPANCKTTRPLLGDFAQGLPLERGAGINLHVTRDLAMCKTPLETNCPATRLTRSHLGKHCATAGCSNALGAKREAMTIEG